MQFNPLAHALNLRNIRMKQPADFSQAIMDTESFNPWAQVLDTIGDYFKKQEEEKNKMFGMAGATVGSIYGGPVGGAIGGTLGNALGSGNDPQMGANVILGGKRRFVPVAPPNYFRR